MCLLSKTASENILKKYIYGETTFNKMSEIQRMLLKGHLRFEETKNKGKIVRKGRRRKLRGVREYPICRRTRIRIIQNFSLEITQVREE